MDKPGALVAEVGDCDKLGVRLYNHLVDYYRITAAIPVYGDTDRGYRGFNLGVLRQGEGWAEYQSINSRFSFLTRILGRW